MNEHSANHQLESLMHFERINFLFSVKKKLEVDKGEFSAVLILLIVIYCSVANLRTFSLFFKFFCDYCLDYLTLYTAVCRRVFPQGGTRDLK